ncbi:MAG: hypothetical protein AB7U29_00925 [Desulfobulbus sp.]
MITEGMYSVTLCGSFDGWWSAGVVAPPLIRSCGLQAAVAGKY